MDSYSGSHFLWVCCFRKAALESGKIQSRKVNIMPPVIYIPAVFFSCEDYLCNKKMPWLNIKQGIMENNYFITAETFASLD